MPASHDVAERFIEQLRAPGEPLTTLLRVHLLLEEALESVLSASVKSAGALNAANLRSFQKICLAEALFADKRPAALWETLRKINKLRNDAAHKLEPVTLAQRMDEVVGTVMPLENSSDVMQGASTEQRFKYAGAALLGQLASLA